MASDTRYYETFYGIYVDDWEESFGGYFTNHHKLLVKEYLSDGCSTTDDSAATNVQEFLYPQHIAKTYFIEGVIKGHITLAASLATATITKYRVDIYKVHATSGATSQLFTTNWVTVNDTLEWDNTYNIGEEMVYPFWIDAWEYEELSEEERIFVRIEVDCDNDTVIWHSNDSTWEDIKIEIPFML